jgi:hypothetical protein
MSGSLLLPRRGWPRILHVCFIGGVIALAAPLAGEAQTLLYKCVDGDQVTYSERLIDCKQVPKKAKAPSQQRADDLPPPGVNMAAEIQAQFEREQAEREEARRAEAAAELERQRVEAARLQAAAIRQAEEEERALEEARLLAARRAGPVTLAQYYQIQESMTYREVAYVLGKAGEEVARNDIAGYVTVMIQWSNRDGSNMNAMFQNGRLVSKAQFGLR